MVEPWSFHSSPTASQYSSDHNGYNDGWSESGGSSYLWDHFSNSYSSMPEPPPDIPLDRIIREVPFPVWHFNILPKLKTEDLLSTLVAITPSRPQTQRDIYTFELLQKSILNRHLLSSVKHTSLERLLSSCQRYFDKSHAYHEYLDQKEGVQHNALKYRTRAGSGEKRKLLEYEQRGREGKARKLSEKLTWGWCGLESMEQLPFDILERIVSQIFVELNVDQSKYPILTTQLTSFMLEAPESMGLVFLKDLKVVLPDSYTKPCQNISAYLAEATQDFRDLYTISCITLKIIYSFACREIRVRIADPDDIIEPQAPEDIDIELLNTDDGWDEQYWDEQSSWENPNYWRALSNRPDVDTKVLMANGICSKMDLSSAIYHAPTHTIEMYSLEQLRVFFHFADEFEVDWRFVGYAVMGSGRQSFHNTRVKLSMYDYYDDHRTHVNDIFLGYSKMIQELHFCSHVQRIQLTGFKMLKEKASELFESLPSLELIRHDHGTFHRCILLPPKLPTSKKKYNLRQNVQSRQQRRLRGATF